jgi:hypothetical protein
MNLLANVHTSDPFHAHPSACGGATNDEFEALAGRNRMRRFAQIELLENSNAGQAEPSARQIAERR